MKARFTREFYIPKGAIKHEGKGYEIYYYTVGTEEKLCAMGFKGRSQKPTFTYSFQTLGLREKYCKEWIEKIQGWQKVKEERRKEKTKPTTLEVGSILSSSWGYDQTNVEFYEVTKVIGKRKIEIREIAQSTVDGSEVSHGMACEVVPSKGQFIGKPMERIATMNRVRICEVVSASEWSGRPKYKSWYA